MDHALDSAFNLVGAFIFMILLVYVAAIVALIFAVIFAIIQEIRYRQWMKKAEEEFEDEMQQLGFDYDANQILSLVFDVGLEPPARAFRNLGDWVAGALFGTDEGQVA